MLTRFSVCALLATFATAPAFADTVLGTLDESDPTVTHTINYTSVANGSLTVVAADISVVSTNTERTRENPLEVTTLSGWAGSITVQRSAGDGTIQTATYDILESSDLVIHFKEGSVSSMEVPYYEDADFQATGALCFGVGGVAYFQLLDVYSSSLITRLSDQEGKLLLEGAVYLQADGDPLGIPVNATGDLSITLAATGAAPEPASAALVLLGAAGAAVVRRRRIA